MNVKSVVLVAVVAVVINVMATPVIQNIVVKQRFPWNGLVDIKCKVVGIEKSAQYKFYVEAVLPDEGITNEVSQFWVVQNGTKQSNYKVTENGDYSLVWDAKAGLGTIRCTNMVVSVGLKDGRDKVQLWEGGPYWATTNIGAENPEDVGYYFWWGDIVGYKYENNKCVASDGTITNFRFILRNAPTFNKGASELKSEGWVTSDYVLAPEHDAASVQWGNGWRMPTKDELSALSSNCDWTFVTQRDESGLLFACGNIIRGRGAYASNSIFLPVSGYVSDEYRSLGFNGKYWSSVMYAGYSEAYNLEFTSDDHHMVYHSGRQTGYTIRPVMGFAE